MQQLVTVHIQENPTAMAGVDIPPFAWSALERAGPSRPKVQPAMIRTLKTQLLWPFLVSRSGATMLVVDRNIDNKGVITVPMDVSCEFRS